MPKANRDFFKQKKIWSKVKDELLHCYLVPYFTKILSMRKPLLYVDCFAGKGKFEDGELGSPLIALKCLKKVKFDGSALRANMKFIEMNHAQDLRENLRGQPAGVCEVIEGKFENKIIPLLQSTKKNYANCNVFLYVDPYGIKVLNAALFDALATEFDAAELLINLNSFGFIREACRLMDVVFREREDEILCDLEAYDSSMPDSFDELDAIAGGDYWQSIVVRYKERSIDCYQTEKAFATQYKLRLRQKYKYVLDMPIRLKRGQQPKYRMVHATNHPDGCILMADNIAKRTDRLVVEIQNGGQLPLPYQTAENEMVDDSTLEKKVLELLSRSTEFTHLNEFLANFYNEYGVLCDSPRLSSGQDGSTLKTLEKNGVIVVQRKPECTEAGKPSRFWKEGRGNSLWLKRS